MMVYIPHNGRNVPTDKRLCYTVVEIYKWLSVLRSALCYLHTKAIKNTEKRDNTEWDVCQTCLKLVFELIFKGRTCIWSMT